MRGVSSSAIPATRFLQYPTPTVGDGIELFPVVKNSLKVVLGGSRDNCRGARAPVS